MPLLETRGATIYYETHGRDDSPPLLLLMGLGTDAHGWEFQVPAFAERYRVILVDNRGVGRSSKPAGPYSTALLAADAIAVLDALSVGKTHLIGLSMGGMIAQELVLAAPDRVGTLGLAVTFARPGNEVEAITHRGAGEFGGAGAVSTNQGSAAPPSPLALLLSGGLDLTKIDLRDVIRFIMPLLHTSEFLIAKRAWFEEAMRRTLAYGFSMEAFLAQVGAVMSHDATARLPSLRTPTLIITGTADALVPPRHSDELQRLIPGARLVKIEGGTHGLNLELPERFNRIVLDFLADHPL